MGWGLETIWKRFSWIAVGFWVVRILVLTPSLKQSQMSVISITCRGSCVLRAFALWYLWFSSLETQTDVLVHQWGKWHILFFHDLYISSYLYLDNAHTHCLSTCGDVPQFPVLTRHSWHNVNSESVHLSALSCRGLWKS